MKRAKDILAVVGPKEMEILGDALVARLILDRIFYSPTGWSQRDKEKERILRYAGATGSGDFLAAIRACYKQGTVDFEAYRAAHHNYRLNDFWTQFATSAREIISDPRPGQKA